MSEPPLYGLVLAGGASSRMRGDKATLIYHDRPQLELAFELLQHYCERAWISVRSDQKGDPGRARLPQILDEIDDFGPLAGIAAAQRLHPQAAWLLLACDLPFVTPALIEMLIGSRDTSALATAFRSAHDGLPEPLCAIWEPATGTFVQDWIASGKHCPRRLLTTIATKLLDLPQRTALDNINTPEEREAALLELSKLYGRSSG